MTSGRGNEVLDVEVVDPTRQPEGASESRGHLMARPAASIFDLDPEAFEGATTRRETNRRLLLDWIRGALVDGTPACYPDPPEQRRTKQGGQWRDNAKYDHALHGANPNGDYGRIYTWSGGWSKPGLWKSGAEKIWGRLGVTPHWPALEAYERSAVGGTKIETIVLRCLLIDAQGHTQAEGCGARSVGQDQGDVNKAIKMAKKSGAIDAVLAFGGLSELFTQDVDEGDEIRRPAGTAKADPAPKSEDPPTSAWLLPIGFGKYGEYTYAELVDGGSDREVAIRGNKQAWCAGPATLGGGRYAWIEYLIDKIEKAAVNETATALDMSRLDYMKRCKARIDARQEG